MGYLLCLSVQEWLTGTFLKTERKFQSWSRIMALSRGLQNAVFDLVAGAAVFGLFYAGLRWAPDNHASILFLMAETIYLLAGVFRGHSAPRNTFLKLLFIV